MFSSFPRHGRAAQFNKENNNNNNNTGNDDDDDDDPDFNSKRDTSEEILKLKDYKNKKIKRYSNSTLREDSIDMLHYIFYSTFT